MSRAYRVRVSRRARVIRREDGAQTTLELLPILPKEQLSELLRQELTRRGFKIEGDSATRTHAGVRVALDLTTGVVDVSGHVDAVVACRELLVERGQERSAARRLEADASSAEDHAIRTALDFGGIAKELDDIVGQVTAEALKKKAVALGDITLLREDTTTGELVIRIKLPDGSAYL